MQPLRIAVIGHVEHVTVGRVPAVPTPGDIAHLDGPLWFPGGGGGVAYYQLLNSDAEVHVFSAVGNDEAGQLVEARLRADNPHVHLARREAPHTRDLVMVDAQGERTIVVLGQPLHPCADDPLPWQTLASFDAIYFTAHDPEVLRLARAARLLLASARRQPSINASGVTMDALLGSIADPRERSARADYRRPPHILVMTEGAEGGAVETAAGVERFEAPVVEDTSGGAYGAGDSFAGAFTYFLAAGLAPRDAAARAAPFGGAVLRSLDTLTAQERLGRPN